MAVITTAASVTRADWDTEPHPVTPPFPDAGTPAPGRHQGNSCTNLELASQQTEQVNAQNRKVNPAPAQALLGDPAHSPWEKHGLLGQVLAELRRGSVGIHVPLHVVRPALGARHRVQEVTVTL